jgi:hypothetical protein
MKLAIVGILILLSVESLAQPSWSVPVRITSGNENDCHPTITDGFGWLYNQEEMLAFSRNGKDICILRTTSLGASWPDSLTFITRDSADNDFPSLIQPYPISYPNESAMLVWQGRRNGNLEILFSKLNQNQWSPPQLITNNTVDDQLPHVGCNDSTYYAVWEQQGKIMFSEFVQGNWSLPRSISNPNDTLNYLPQVTRQYQYPPPSYQPYVVWQSRHESSRSFVLLASFRTGTGWSIPDTLVSDGDNRRPRFFKYGQQSVLTWDKRTGLFPTTYGGYVSITNGRSRLGSISPVNNFSDTMQNSSFNGHMVVTANNPLSFFYSAGAWESPSNDSIGVRLAPFGLYGGTQLSPRGATANRNPVISQGTPVLSGGFRVRFWAVWEAFVNSKWQLYGSNAVLQVDDVDDVAGLPRQFELLQNYPNPFNPTTEIRYRTPEAGLTSLKISDLLGREVAVLVDEVQDAGLKSVRFDASDLATGVYYYTLVAGKIARTKMMILIR